MCHKKQHQHLLQVGGGQPYVPTAQCSTALCSHSPMFPQPYIPTALCSHISKSFFKIGSYVPPALCSHISNIHYNFFLNKSWNIELWEHRAEFSKLSVKKKSLEMWEHRADPQHTSASPVYGVPHTGVNLPG